MSGGYDQGLMECLFDLDGTLTDPARGITQCIKHALISLGRPSPPVELLKRYIGPPLRDTFVELLDKEDGSAIDVALGHYRERFAAVGIYENEVYQDVPHGLAALRESGHRLWVATSKPEVFARRILEHFELSFLFEDVYGSELSGERADKGTLIAHLLDRERLDPSDVWMIGDRAHDIVGGRANQTCTMGVLWGTGARKSCGAPGLTAWRIRWPAWQVSSTPHHRGRRVSRDERRCANRETTLMLSIVSR